MPGRDDSLVRWHLSRGLEELRAGANLQVERTASAKALSQEQKGDHWVKSGVSKVAGGKK